jgi:hypothetical protein
MKKWHLLFLPVSAFFYFIYSHNKVDFPAPDNGHTEVKTDAEEGDNQNKREEWFNMLHQTAPGVFWRDIEYNNAIDNQKIINTIRKYSSSDRNDDEILAGGNILGRWYERGSSNQAGNVIAAAFDKKAEEIFLVSGGGSLFKGNRSGLGWEVINQDLRFSSNLMELFFLQDGKRRLQTSVNHRPHFSDDGGITWTEGTGIIGAGDGYLYHPKMTSDQQLFFLQKSSYWAPIRLYHSADYGESYTSVFNFNTHDDRNIAMDMDKSTNDIFVISQKAGNLSNIYKYSASNKSWNLLTSDSPLGFGENGMANLNVVNNNGVVSLYAYDEDLKLQISNDFGVSWTYLSTLPSSPWSVSLFVSPSNPKHMIYGEVDAYRSRDGGKTWQKINAWHEYYNNVNSKLHADIMSIKEFSDEDGRPFILISNHGGLSITYDYGINNDNIGLFDLNVSQYYDVRSYPSDPNFVFAGSQDQGFQKGFIPGTNPEPLVQVISGDYGHIVFTENGQRLWTVYPGGWVTYYPTPRSSGSVASYEVNSDEESVWIPPLTPSPLPSENSVYMAGGNVNGGKGSHLIKLTYNPQNNNIEATQLPFNFKNSGGELSAIAFSPFNSKKIYCATTNGRLYISENGGSNFTYHAINVPGAQYLYGSCILPSSLDSNLVYICGTGYSNPGVMVSKNGGKTFTALKNGLPNTTVFKIVFNEDESLIYAATEAGPYVYVKSLEEWFLLSGSNTPNQTFWSVEYIPQLKIARFGTYGRGIWDFHFKDFLSSSSNDDTPENAISLYPIPASDFLNISFNYKNSTVNRFGIFDVQGNKLELPVEKINGQLFKINISALSDGIYFIVHYHSKNKSIKKFIKLNP